MADVSWGHMAWNGMAMQIPDTWRPVQIDARHLLLADSDRVVFEIKWSWISGRFVPEKRLGAWRRQQRLRLEIQSHSPKWRASLKRFDATVFHWRKAPQSGRGALLYCPVCGHATWLQFFDPVSPALCLRLLASITDHTTEAMQRIAVFDIDARIPADFKLSSHRFDAGRFLLDFSRRKQQLSLMRWSPATALLAGETLAKTAARLTSLPPVTPAYAPDCKHDNLQWQQPLHGKRWAVLPTAGQDWLRLWHVPSANRLLAVRLHSPQSPIDKNEFKAICNGYQVVQNPKTSNSDITPAGPALPAHQKPADN